MRGRLVPEGIAEPPDRSAGRHHENSASSVFASRRRGSSVPGRFQDRAAQSYPTRPIRLIIGYTPGGSADLTARLMGQWLSERLGQSFVIENRPGGGTNIATEAALRAAPDGYSLLLVAPANAINATLFEQLNFNFLQEIVPIAGIIRFPNVVVVTRRFR